MTATMKILLIRFSSFGDVTECLSVPSKLTEAFPHSEIHWLTRNDLAPLLEHHKSIHRIIRFDRKLGLLGLMKLAWSLRQENYSHIYDIHNNLRSRIVCLLLKNFFSSRPLLLRRPVYRWKRFLLFRFRINRFQMPFSGQRDMLQPMKKWGLTDTLPLPPQIFVQDHEVQRARDLLGSFSNALACAPSAAYHLKRWPKQYWIDLIRLLPTQKFILLGGAEDGFIQDIADAFPERTLNLSGKTNFRELCAIVNLAKGVIANDTGILHVGEQLGKKCIALMGPAPFGFPSRPTTKILERQLPCKPCSKHGKGPCRNKNYHQCLLEIHPYEVAKHTQEWLS